MVPHGSPWFPMVPHGSPWFPMVPHGSPWFPMVPKDWFSRPMAVSLPCGNQRNRPREVSFWALPFKNCQSHEPMENHDRRATRISGEFVGVRPFLSRFCRFYVGPLLGIKVLCPKNAGARHHVSDLVPMGILNREKSDSRANRFGQGRFQTTGFA